MGKKGRRRKEELRRLRKDRRKLERENIRLRTSQKKQWHQYAVTKAATITIFLFQNLWGAAMLNSLSPVSAYIVFILVNSAIIGFWTWKFIDWIWGKYKFATLVRAMGIVIGIFAFLITSPNYINYVIRPEGSIEIEPYTPDSTEVTVHYGRRDNDFFYTKTTIGELKQSPQTAFRITIGNNDLTIFYVHIKERELCVDTYLFTGIENQQKRTFSQPVVIKDNAPDKLPDGWAIHKSGTIYEIDNQDGIPVLLMEYINPNSVIISGLFVTPMGICKVDNDEGTIYRLGDSLSELGTYKVDNVFFVDRPFFDQVASLFRSERVYDLSEY